MAFKNGLSERLEELRFSSPRSPPSDSPFSSYPSPTRGQPASYISAFHPPSDVRANLQRRFTTDASKLSSWPAFNNTQPLPFPESLDFLSSATQIHKSQLFEKKKAHIEYMREQRKRFEADMKLLDLQQEKERQELDQMARDLANANSSLAGAVSEPTTPPEYRDNGFPTAFSRPTRFSTSSATAPGVFNLFGPSQVVSPTGQAKSVISTAPSQASAPQSLLGSRRNSEEEYPPEPFPSFRQGASSINRYSLPTSSFGSQSNSTTTTATATVNGFSRSIGLNPFHPAKFAFGDDDDEDRRGLKDDDRIPTPDVKSYLKLTDPDDKFPTLIRRDDNSGLLSANSAALDLANSRTPGPESYGHRHHASLPHNSLNMSQHVGNNRSQGEQISAPFSPTSDTRQSHRHSLEPGFSTYHNTQSLYCTANGSQSRPASLQMSYSTNDIPTKNNGYTAVTPPKSHSEHFHSHISSVGRVPATPHSHANDTTPASPMSPEREDQAFNLQPLQSVLQASATPFGPQLTSPTNGINGINGINGMPNGTSAMASFPNPVYGYAIQPFITSPLQANGQTQAFQPNPPYGSYINTAPYSPYARFPESPARNPGQGRRSGDGESVQFSRFGNAPLETYQGELYGMCKDQYGCRYLQKKLEEQNPAHVQMIFLETHIHVVELMTDPFGNYLCQKLLEYSNDEQRTALINNAAPQLVKIALNQHGTRALQKMIEFISTPEQTQTVINALRDRVVELVQDLNGNHVIQKCLNRLSAPDAQFIYDAVGTSCVAVGTHRHGCCVLQRCIDHASGEQRARLIEQITNNAFTLVQDPFGNYVVQYILDLNEPHFIEPICRSFRGNIPALSKQKFSSNVIEKCIRTADPQSRSALVEEMLVPSELEKMLRDSFANYVVQTAMDFADPEYRTKLIEAIRPILPAIRQTPHGRRIAGKILSVENQGRVSGGSSGQITPNDMTNVYHQIHPFPNSIITQYPQQQFNNVGDNMINKATATNSSSSSASSAANGSNSSANTPPATGNVNGNEGNSPTIYSPIPQQATNGINAFPVQGYPFFS
ncbi:RNA-binding protein [Blastomyces dermatitidis ER-3]|uniref:RNA-binding protein n=1 Tax=Ajellomyces dermatitidis (strain ER-3 / ATCC MYA-2586) TaxID=559297 RepID=A0ABX2VWT7_AJEDR|nr:RNA-binding protein [Blastomyces dermatitidis ER-3]OAT01602.1 RNA-binding protein [Blastomyces dermatitidis ER-3]